jgi:hypothetical protein
MNCVLDNGVRILSRSRGQKVRGVKHRQHRPSLVVADDVEDLDWVRTQENRDKSDRWFRGNVLPLVDERTGRVVVIGDWPHTDGLMARLKNTGLFKVLEFSLLREGDGTEFERCTWKAKYPTQEAIDRKRDELGDIGFRREMLFQAVPEEGQDVHPEDITYYDDPPFDDGNYLAHGVDLAIWRSTSSPHPIIRRMTFTDTMTALDDVRHGSTMSQRVLRGGGRLPASSHRGAGAPGVSVQAMHPIKDKRARLRVAARYIKNGTVKFPRHGCEQLLTQLLGFGAEKHDDAVDTLVYLILSAAGDGIKEPRVHHV